MLPRRCRLLYESARWTATRVGDECLPLLPRGRSRGEDGRVCWIPLSPPCVVGRGSSPRGVGYTRGLVRMKCNLLVVLLAAGIAAGAPIQSRAAEASPDEAEVAWKAVQKALRPPAPPAEWQT